MKFNTQTIIGLLAVAAAVTTTEGKALRGSRSMQQVDPATSTSASDATILSSNNSSSNLPTPSESSYRKYLDRLQQSKGDTTFPIPAVAEGTNGTLLDDTLDVTLDATSSSGSSPIHPNGRITAAFPPGVFNISRANDAEYMIGLQDRCTNTQKNTAEEVLGCHIFSEGGSKTPPFATGPITLGTSLFDARDHGLYKTDSFTNILNDNATAVMIDSQCWVLDTSHDEHNEYSIAYYDAESYNNQMTSSNGIDFNPSIGFGPFQIHVGYNRQSHSFSSNSGNTRKAYGEHRYFSQVGMLTNKCLSERQYFEAVIKNKNLIKQDVIDKWEEVQSATDASQLSSTNAFQQVASEGQKIPVSYMYGASASYIVEFDYQQTVSNYSESVTTAINAGLSGTYDGVDGTVDGDVKSETENAASENGLSITASAHKDFVGHNLSPDCFVHGTCAEDVDRSKDETRQDLNNLDLPYSHYSFIDLNNIVTWQTGADLGPAFSDALKNNYIYAECNLVADIHSPATPPIHFTTYNGYGEVKSSDNSCHARKICVSGYYNAGNNADVTNIASNMCTIDPLQDSLNRPCHVCPSGFECAGMDYLRKDSNQNCGDMKVACGRPMWGGNYCHDIWCGDYNNERECNGDHRCGWTNGHCQQHL